MGELRFPDCLLSFIVYIIGYIPRSDRGVPSRIYSDLLSAEQLWFLRSKGAKPTKYAQLAENYAFMQKVESSSPEPECAIVPLVKVLSISKLETACYLKKWVSRCFACAFKLPIFRFDPHNFQASLIFTNTGHTAIIWKIVGKPLIRTG